MCDESSKDLNNTLYILNLHKSEDISLLKVRIFLISNKCK